VLADRREHRATRHDLPDFAAFREVLPNMPEEQAKLETTQAIAFAAPAPEQLLRALVPLDVHREVICPAALGIGRGRCSQGRHAGLSASALSQI
jgi:hypothetical protein